MFAVHVRPLGQKGTIGLPGSGCHELIEFLMKWTDPSQKVWLAPHGWLLDCEMTCIEAALSLNRTRSWLPWIFGGYMVVPIVSVLPATHQCQQFWSAWLRRP